MEKEQDILARLRQDIIDNNLHVKAIIQVKKEIKSNNTIIKINFNLISKRHHCLFDTGYHCFSWHYRSFKSF